MGTPPFFFQRPGGGKPQVIFLAVSEGKSGVLDSFPPHRRRKCSPNSGTFRFDGSWGLAVVAAVSPGAHKKVGKIHETQTYATDHILLPPKAGQEKVRDEKKNPRVDPHKSGPLSTTPPMYGGPQKGMGTGFFSSDWGPVWTRVKCGQTSLAGFVKGLLVAHSGVRQASPSFLVDGSPG